MFRRPGMRLARIACIATSFVFTVLSANADAAESRVKRNGLNPVKLRTSKLHAPNREIQVFVRLDEPAVAELNAQSMEQTGQFAASDRQKAQAARVSEQQNAFRPTLQSIGARILASQRVGANGFRVLVKPSEIASLRQMPGVRSVGRVEIHRPDNTESVPWIGSPTVWSAVGKGKGVKIGIIDTGIDYTHAAFGGSGNPADYAANNKLVVEPGSFPVPGGAVKGGIDLAGATYNADDPESVPVPDNDPLDGNGHGTHVAATAAGRGVPGSVGVGVAPEADLYAIKVFGDAAGSTDLTSAAIEWAMDPNGDGDMADHLDVINMSLGAPFGYPDDPSAISSENAAKLGIIVVASAGNEGPNPYVTGAPAVAPSAISVAASTPGGRVYARLTITAPASVGGVYPSVEGAGPVTFKSVGPVSGAVVPTTPADGCTAPTNDVAGKIALIVRGGCNFVIKYQTAQAAGAKAVIVYNDGTTPDREEPIVMGLDPTATIPGLMISFTNGVKLRDAGGVQATIDAARDATKDDAITSFSSLGPGSATSAFKPDLSAPGDAIVSAGVGSGTGSANLSGTSMAAPHVAGAAALLRQQHPDLNQSDIKALLQNSAVTANPSVDTRLTRQGTGVIRVDRASKLTSFAKPGGVSFGRLNPLLPIVRSEKIRITNLSGKPRNFSGKHVANRTMPGVSVTCPGNVSVGGSRSARTEIFLKFDPIASAKQNVSDDGAVSQKEVDGWCVLSDGKDQLRIGYAAVVDPASSVIVTSNPRSQKVTVRNLGPAVGLAEGFTLAKTGGENTNHTENSIAAVGFRRADPNLYDGVSVLEFGVATEAPFNHLSALRFDMAIDTNKDGVAEFRMVGTDLSSLDDSVDPGTFITAQFVGEDVFPDWVVNTWDFNDRVFILPFTLVTGGGLLPEKFDYVLSLVGHDGDVDIQRGSVDLSKEIVPDLNSFSIAGGEKVDVQMSGGKGLSLWLLQNNPLFGQFGITATQ
jgi:minor extracellular serine protease Vpr